MPTSGPPGCPVCGTPPVPGARFCFACGAPLPSTQEAFEQAERRVVTVLFGDLSEFTAWAEDLDPERVGVVTDRVLAALADTVTEFGGHVDKLTGDGLMALFGAPTSHEDDAERAVRAADAMQRTVRQLVAEESGGGRRLGLRVGLNTGEVLAGIQAALSYTVVGDTVNTAARLSDAAGVGAVLAGQDTALATMDAASWRALPPLRLKGKREPVPAYELVGLRAQRSDRLGVGEEAPFVGREAEVGLLIGRFLDVMESGRPQQVFLVGEAGIGKSRLAEEVSRFAGELPGARVLWGRCRPYGAGRDLAPLVELVRTALGIGSTDDAATIEQRVHRGVSRLEHPAYSGLVPAGLADQLLGLLGVGAKPGGPSGADAVTPGTTTGDDPLLSGIGALFSGLATEGPLLLVVDDLHWAGPALVSALDAVAGRLSGRVLSMGIGRGTAEVMPTAWAADGREPLTTVEILPVEPLEDAAAERLLRAYLGGAELPAEVRDELLGRAAGNPFFLGELLRLLVDRGVLRQGKAGWVVTGSLPSDVLPAGVQSLLAARLDELPSAAKAVLRDAAVLGVRFGLTGLSVLAGTADGAEVPAGVWEGLDGLLRAGLVVPREEPPEYAFAHTLARDVAYATIPKADRARRHATVATWAAEHPRGSQAEVDAFVAAQAEQALRLAAEMTLPVGDPAWRARGVAVEALTRLGALALARDDGPGGEEVLSRALRLAVEDAPGPAVDRAEVLRVRVDHARALAALGRSAEAEGELADALLAEDVRLRARALVVLGDLRRRAGLDAEAAEVFVRALAVAGAAGDDRTAGEALRQLGLVDYRGGRLKAAEDRFTEALGLAERVDDQRGAGWALQHLAWSATTRGDWLLAEDALERAADVFAALEDTGGLSWCAGTEGFVRLLQGRYAEARDLAQSLLPLGEAQGEVWGVAACLTIDAVAAAELGDVATAREEARSAARRFASAGDVWGQSFALVARAIAERGADESRKAISRLREAERLSRSGGHLVITALALTLRGWCHLDRREPGAAEQAAQQALEIQNGLDLAPHARVGTMVLFAQARRARGDLTQALAVLGEAVELAESTALLFPRRQALAHLAGTLLECGLAEDAVEIAERAVGEPAEDVRSRTLALRALGTALVAVGRADEARAYLEEALEIARSTGQRSEVAASERALAAAPR